MAAVMVMTVTEATDADVLWSIFHALRWRRGYRLAPRRRASKRTSVIVRAADLSGPTERDTSPVPHAVQSWSMWRRTKRHLFYAPAVLQTECEETIEVTAR